MIGTTSKNMEIACWNYRPGRPFSLVVVEVQQSGSRMPLQTAALAPVRAANPALNWPKVLIVLALVLALYADVLIDLAQEWWTVDASSYGMLVPPLTLYIAYLRRGTTLKLPAERDWRGLLLTAFGCVVLLSG